MTALIDPDILTGREITDAECAERVAVLTEGYFMVQNAADALRGALFDLPPAHSAFGPCALALVNLTMALTAVDLESAAAVPKPNMGSVFDEADADDIAHGHQVWWRQRIAAAKHTDDIEF